MITWKCPKCSMKRKSEPCIVHYCSACNSPIFVGEEGDVRILETALEVIVHRAIEADYRRKTKYWFYGEKSNQYGTVHLRQKQAEYFDTGAIVSIGIDIDALEPFDQIKLQKCGLRYTTREDWANSGREW